MPWRDAGRGEEERVAGSRTMQNTLFPIWQIIIPEFQGVRSSWGMIRQGSFAILMLIEPCIKGFILFDVICVYCCSAACFVFFHLFKDIVSVVWCWFCVDGFLCACLLIVLIVNYIHCTASIKKVCYMTHLVLDVWIFSMTHHINSIINMKKLVCVY